MSNKYNNNNFNHRRNFIDAFGLMAINSYGEVFIIGAEVKHDDKNAPNAKIESFDIDKDSGEVIAFTDKGYCHIDFMTNLLSDTGISEWNRDAYSYGVDKIAEERFEQVEKHGFFISKDIHYDNEELIQAAKFCIDSDDNEWPMNRMTKFKDKILSKTRLQRLIIAGAFIAAEIDRIINKNKLKQ